MKHHLVILLLMFAIVSSVDPPETTDPVKEAQLKVDEAIDACRRAARTNYATFVAALAMPRSGDVRGYADNMKRVQQRARECESDAMCDEIFDRDFKKSMDDARQLCDSKFLCRMGLDMKTIVGLAFGCLLAMQLCASLWEVCSYRRARTREGA